MTTFSIDSGGGIASRDSEAKTRQNAIPQADRFGSKRELAKVTRTWPLARLAATWNQLPAAVPLSRFKDRKTAVGRIWKTIQPKSPTSASPVGPAAGSRVHLAVAKLEQAMKAAIAATAGAEQSGREIGYEVRFSAGDIRAFAFTAITTSSPERFEADRKEDQQ